MYGRVGGRKLQQKSDDLRGTKDDRTNGFIGRKQRFETLRQ